jgi:hypothetical protein
MSSEAWGSLAPKLLRSFGGSSCEAGYTAASTPDHAPLVAAIDDYARDNGPTDELVAQLAPAARGDLVLTLTVAGHPPAPEKVSVQNETGGGSMRGPGPSAPQRGAQKPKDTNALDLVATLFSVSQHRSVGEIEMEYTGETVDDAVARFTEKLGASLPHARCAGWDWTVPIDPNRIGSAR